MEGPTQASVFWRSPMSIATLQLPADTVTFSWGP